MLLGNVIEKVLSQLYASTKSLDRLSQLSVLKLRWANWFSSSFSFFLIHWNRSWHRTKRGRNKSIHWHMPIAALHSLPIMILQWRRQQKVNQKQSDCLVTKYVRVHSFVLFCCSPGSILIAIFCDREQQALISFHGVNSANFAWLWLQHSIWTLRSRDLRKFVGKWCHIDDVWNSDAR